MTTRTYDRNTIMWRPEDLEALEAAGQATYFPAAFTYVVKLPEGGSVAVRPTQLLPAEDPFDDDSAFEAAAEAELAYERYLEDGGPHAAAIQAEDDYERQLEAQDPFLQYLRNEDDILAHFGI